MLPRFPVILVVMFNLLGISSAMAADIVVADAYARAATPVSKTGAAFMTITNEGDVSDRLIGVASDIAERVELHSHVMNDGVMQMLHAADGWEIAAGATHVLERGGDHVMFMGLTKSLVPGETVVLTLFFETAGEITVEIPVDLER